MAKYRVKHQFTDRTDKLIEKGSVYEADETEAAAYLDAGWIEEDDGVPVTPGYTSPTPPKPEEGGGAPA